MTLGHVYSLNVVRLHRAVQVDFTGSVVLDDPTFGDIKCG